MSKEMGREDGKGMSIASGKKTTGRRSTVRRLWGGWAPARPLLLALLFAGLTLTLCGSDSDSDSDSSDNGDGSPAPSDNGNGAPTPPDNGNGAPAPDADSIIITRWADDGADDPKAFVEIANPTGSVVNLAGWSLRKKGTEAQDMNENDENDCMMGSELVTFPPTASSLNIAARNYYLFTTEAYESGRSGAERLGRADPAPKGDGGSSFGRLIAGIGTDNEDNELYLCNSADEEVDRAPGSGSFDGYMAGYAIERKLNSDMDNYIDSDSDSDWELSSGSQSYDIFRGTCGVFLGIAWPLCAHPTTSPHLVINELSYNIGSTGTVTINDQFVEIYNPSDSAVDLEGMRVEAVKDTIKYAEATLSGSLAADAYLVVDTPGDSSEDLMLPGGAAADFQLSGALDEDSSGIYGIRLVSSDGALIDAVTSYIRVVGPALDAFFEGEERAPSDSVGQSVSRCPNGADTNTNSADFVKTARSTPGEANRCP